MFSDGSALRRTALVGLKWGTCGSIVAARRRAAADERFWSISRRSPPAGWRDRLCVEIWTWQRGILRATGGAFALPICVGIAIGRFGYRFAGLPDDTCGTPTSLLWVVDPGDSIGRHPVEIREAASMALFAIFYFRTRSREAHWARTCASIAPKSVVLLLPRVAVLK